MYSKILISGRLVEPADDKPRSGVTLTLYSVKNSSVVLKHATYRCVTGGNGEYSFNAAPGTYAVAVSVYGAEPERVGQIRVYSDSLPGDLNTFLMAPAEDDLTPEIIRLVDSMRSEAVKAAEFAKQSEQVTSKLASDVATHAEQVASNTVVVEQKTTIATDAAATAVAAKEQASKDALATGKDRQVTQTKAQEAAASANAAKAAQDSIVEDATDVRDKALQVAENTTLVANNAVAVQLNTEQVAQNTQTVTTKTQQVSENAQAVAANTRAVTQMRDEVVAKTSMAQAAADTATQKAASAAEHDAAAAEYARRAQEAAQATAGALMDGGAADLSAGVYPQPVVVSGTSRPTFWKVTKGGTVGGVDYGVGDTLIYTVADSGSYYKIDNTESVTSVQGEKGAVTLTPEKIGAESAGTAAAIVQQHSEAPDPHSQYAKKMEVDPKGIASEKVNEHASKSGAHQISGVAGLRDELDKLARPVLSVEWVPKREAMWDGCAPADGQLLPRTLYPSALTAIQSGLVPVCTDAEWLADPTKRGCFTLGDGSTNFRLPDYNGRSEGAIGAPVFRGDGKNAPANGMIQGDAIRNFSAVINFHGQWADNNGGTPVSSCGGAAKGLNYQFNYSSGTRDGSATSIGEIEISPANGGVPTGPENRMVNLGGCWTIRLFGSVQNVGSADAAALATAVAALASRITALEVRKSTCLVHARGTGAPHETVVSQLPSAVVANSRYVLPNPFGNDTPVIVWAEIFYTNKWANSGFVFAQGGYGTVASYVQGEGIVVQTGSSDVASTSANIGGGHGTPVLPNLIGSAPCRVFVRKLEL